MMDYPCGKFGECSFSRFCSIMWKNRQTYRHSHRHKWTPYSCHSHRRE